MIGKARFFLLLPKQLLDWPIRKSGLIRFEQILKDPLWLPTTIIKNCLNKNLLSNKCCFGWPHFLDYNALNSIFYNMNLMSHLTLASAKITWKNLFIESKINMIWVYFSFPSLICFQVFDFFLGQPSQFRIVGGHCVRGTFVFQHT